MRRGARKWAACVIFSVAVSQERSAASNVIGNAVTQFADGERPAGAAATKIVAIAGASGSGKTYLSTYVAERLGAPVLSLDAYYLDLSHLPLAERAQWNFDDPAALDWELLRTQLAALRAGRGVDAPVYDFSTHTRTQRVRRIEAREYLVLEGIFALYDEAVRKLLRLGLFIEYRDDGCLERRIARDVAERGRTASSVREQYDLTVRPMFEEHIAPTRQFARLVVRGDDPLECSFERLLEILAAER